MILLKIFGVLGNDFVVYYEAAKMFLAGANPYQGLITRTFPLNYPPPIALLLWPLGFLDFRTANILWNISSLASVIVSVWLLLKIVQKDQLISPKVFLVFFTVLSLLFTVFFFPVKFDIGNAQINHFLLLFCVLAIYFYQQKHRNLSAFFLAFATGIKFAPGIFVLYFVIRKDWGQVSRFFFWVTMIFLLPFLFVPASYQWDYLTKVFPLSFTAGAKDWYYNQSLWGFLARSFRTNISQYLFYSLSLFILFLTWLRGRNLPWKRQLAAVSCLYLLIHPIALQHYFSFAIFPLILLGWEIWQTKGSKGEWLVLAIGYILLATDIKNFQRIPKEFNFVLSHDFFAVFFLWIFALWREKFWQIIGVIWITVISASYIFMLLCRAKFCL